MKSFKPSFEKEDLDSVYHREKKDSLIFVYRRKSPYYQREDLVFLEERIYKFFLIEELHILHSLTQSNVLHRHLQLV